MKRIGRGYYYNVYDTGEGRVLKEIAPWWSSMVFILFANGTNIQNGIAEYRNVRSALSQIPAIYQQLFAKLPDLGLLGNPKIIEGANYTQDRVAVLRQIVDHMSDDDFLSLVEKYTELIKTLWSCGVSDPVYNFSYNNGLAANGELVWIDFNEVGFEKSAVARDIEQQIWLNRKSYKALSSSKKILFKNIMERELTINALEQHWCKSIH
jgi:hypothetical protein